MDLIFLLGRILFGGYFLYHGIGHFTEANKLAGFAGTKHVPSPKLAVYFSGLLIFLGGAGVLLGVYTNLALVCLVVFLVPVTFIMHQFWREADPAQRTVQTVSFMKNLALLGAILMMFSFQTPWPISF